MKTVSWESTVTNPNGMHCRVAERLMKVIDAHEATVQIVEQGQLIDCSSILELLSLALVQGSRVRFTAQGPDAEQVVAAVEEVLAEPEPLQDASFGIQQGASNK
ncbi:MAG: HPr family phosphocarrier protein [Candidatus Electrothrix sp. GW3-4]|uniref:HPr family phosphocarrier protein n=1 Tax=Candidatus Electrothrix sp. GW3-4 TaxID=3126740 RepID=UPI0030CFB8DB